MKFLFTCFLIYSMPNMTGRPGYWTMEMNGGSSAAYLACTPCVSLFVLCLTRVEAEGLLDYQGRAGIISLYGGTVARSYLFSSLCVFSLPKFPTEIHKLMCLDCSPKFLNQDPFHGWLRTSEHMHEAGQERIQASCRCFRE